MPLVARITRFTHHPNFRYLVPSLVIVLQCYGVWAFSHQFCYLRLYEKFHDKAACIGLIIANLFLTFLVWYIWALIVIIGPGQQPHIPPFSILPDAVTGIPATNTSLASANSVRIDESSISPPDIYPCDDRGYPIWCSTCQSLKMSRTHHSNKLGYCVPRFDHYCVWIGSVIGRSNHRMFVQFTFYLMISSLIMVISIGSQMKKLKHHTSGNVYAVFILACCALFMVGPLFLTHVYYMCCNRTSIEVIEVKNKKKASRKCFCIYNPFDGYRYVVQFLPGEGQDFWNKNNALINLKEFLGDNYFFWFFPTVLHSKSRYGEPSDNFYDLIGECDETLSDQYRQCMFDKIEKKEYLTRLRA